VTDLRDVILDMDCGIDDAIAILYLASRPSARIVAAGSVHGNTPALAAADNLLRVLALAGLPNVPVAAGAQRPLVRPPHFAAEVHGDDGLGNTNVGAAPGAVTGESAPEQIVRLARAEPGRYDLLATGPLTNVGIALLLEPELPRLLRSVTVMGGAANASGNMTPLAEANIWHDPEAAKLVFDAPWAVTMVGLDVTMRTVLDEAHIAQLAAGTSAQARFASAILRHYLDFYERISGRRACPLHDPTAAAVLAEPDLVVEAYDANVDVACSDDAQGATIVDRRANGRPAFLTRQPATRVITKVDAERFADDLVAALLA
jgi:purine nucleosidase